VTVKSNFGSPRVSGGLAPAGNSGTINLVVDRRVTCPVQSPSAGSGIRVVVVIPLSSSPQLILENHLSACAILDKV
jgi:hypothetical protein